MSPSGPLRRSSRRSERAVPPTYTFAPSSPQPHSPPIPSTHYLYLSDPWPFRHFQSYVALVLSFAPPKANADGSHDRLVFCAITVSSLSLSLLILVTPLVSHLWTIPIANPPFCLAFWVTVTVAHPSNAWHLNYNAVCTPSRRDIDSAWTTHVDVSLPTFSLG